MSIIDQISQLTISRKPDSLEEERRKMERDLFLKFPSSKPKITTIEEVAKSLDNHEVLIDFKDIHRFLMTTKNGAKKMHTWLLC